MNIVFLLIPVLLLFFLFIYWIKTGRATPYAPTVSLEETESLLNEIEQLEIYRNLLIDEIEARRSNSFPSMVTRVLDRYEQSNIRIPADILEELSRNGFTNESDVESFIENQRHHWKLENSKKVYK